MKNMVVILACCGYFACGGGGGGGGTTNPPPPPPTDLTLTQGFDFDLVHLRWTPPTSPVDNFVAEDRINSGSWVVENTLLPGNAIGADVMLVASTPELVTLGCRLRSVKGGVYSSYTPEATLLRGLRPPSGLVAHTRTEDVELTWTRGSMLADNLVIERATWDMGRATFGAYSTLATLPGSATTYLDHPTDGPMVTYGYRIRYSATFNGSSHESTPVLQSADQTTSLAPPTALTAATAAPGVRLTWSIQSRNLQGQVVERAVGLGAGDIAFTAVAYLGPAITTYSDPVGPGPYTYRIRSTTTATGLGYAPSAPGEVSILVPPSPGPWALQAQTLRLPLGDGLARAAEGTWVVAANWCIGPANPRGLTLWRPSGAAWETRVCGPAQGPGRFVSPGVVLDGGGHPHALYLKDTGGVVVPGPLIVMHLWHDGAQWQEETIATRTFFNGNVRYPVEFTLDVAGRLHVLWRTDRLVGQVSTPVLEYATNASGSWVLGSLPTNLVTDLSRIQGFRLATTQDGTLFVALAANTNASQGPNAGSLLLLRKPAGGAWLEELAFADTLYIWGEVPFVLLPLDAERLGFLFQQQTVYPSPNIFRYATRTASGWGPAETLGECATGSGYLVPHGAIRSDGGRIAALLPTPAGTNLLTWDGTHGWSSTLVRPPDPFGLPWLAFDAQGTLHALVPCSAADSNGLASWLELTATQ